MGNCLQSFKCIQHQHQDQHLQQYEQPPLLTDEEPQQKETLPSEVRTGFALIPSFLSSSFSSSSSSSLLPNICPHPKHWLRSYLENYIFWQLQDWRARFCKREYLYVVAGTLATEIVVYLVLHGPRRMWTSSSSSRFSHWVCHCKPYL